MITLNTYSPQTQYTRQSSANNRKYTPQFTASAEKIGKAVTNKSNFLKSFYDKCNKKYDEGAEWIAQKVLPKVFDNKFTDKFTDKVKNSDLLFNHFLAVGSAITSGMYMYKTLNNDQMDKDRRNTLAVNQFLTFALSTAGAYTLDKSLSNWWQEMTVRYAAVQCKDDDMKLLTEYKKEVKDAKEANVKIKAENKALKEAAKKEGRKIAKEELKGYKSVKADKFLEKRVGKYLGTPEEVQALTKKIKGMGLLKTMLVFALVYRYLVPVAVTKPANILCDKYLAHKKEKENAKNA